jgi:hypothetical protein
VWSSPPAPPPPFPFRSSEDSRAVAATETLASPPQPQPWWAPSPFFPSSEAWLPCDTTWFVYSKHLDLCTWFGNWWFMLSHLYHGLLVVLLALNLSKELISPYMPVMIYDSFLSTWWCRWWFLLFFLSTCPCRWWFCYFSWALVHADSSHFSWALVHSNDDFSSITWCTSPCQGCLVLVTTRPVKYRTIA